MTRNYEPDDITEADVLRQLDSAGLQYRVQQRYIISQCPFHEDKNPSIQIYKDDWFCLCHAGCEGGRFHITKAFPELRSHTQDASYGKKAYTPPAKATKMTQSVKYQDKTAEITRIWESLPLIPDSHTLHNVPAEALNDNGWRWDEQNNRYLIPYFKPDKKTIQFAQWRNLSGNVRFNFWKDVRPILYGAWNIEPNETLFLVEGTSDGMVLDYCAVPWLAIPSASSGELIRKIAPWLQAHNVEIIFAGDNDTAGNKVRDVLDEVMYYRVRQPKKPYKDWGEMLEAEGVEAITDYCFPILFGNKLKESKNE
jgi:DNA primase